MLYLRIIVGLALLLMAAFGPGVGFRRITNPNLDPRAAAKRHLDQRRAAVLILRILAAMLGLWLLLFSSVQLLHGHHSQPLPPAMSQIRAPHGTPLDSALPPDGAPYPNQVSVG